MDRIRMIPIKPFRKGQAITIPLVLIHASVDNSNFSVFESRLFEPINMDGFYPHFCNIHASTSMSSIGKHCFWIVQSEQVHLCRRVGASSHRMANIDHCMRWSPEVKMSSSTGTDFWVQGVWGSRNTKRKPVDVGCFMLLPIGMWIIG